MSKRFGFIGMFFILLVSFPVLGASKGKVLVLLSGETVLPLQDGKQYTTGFYLNELSVPVKHLVDAGYEVVFANPKGNAPTMDVHSDSAKYFGNDEISYTSHKAFLDGLTGLKHPQKISAVISAGLEQFDAVFVPGGHAPMIDLRKDKDVGRVLTYFHKTGKPTALICHGPIALLSTLSDPDKFAEALTRGDEPQAERLAKTWPYAGYRMTIFSTKEEQFAEGKQLGGKMLFYPDYALKTAGGNTYEAPLWQSNAIRDRELITGQNPYSDEQLSGLLLAALRE